MSAVQLRRVDPAANVSRFYMMQVQPDLFGRFCLIREWGRIGQPGRVMTQDYATLEAAEAALSDKLVEKERRGYASPAFTVESSERLARLTNEPQYKPEKVS